MSSEAEKVYVALGNDLQDGFKTLLWTLQKWKSHPFSIVILHVSFTNNSNDFVYTPFGKLPASSVSEEKVEVLRRYEQDKIDKLLSKYIDFCGKVKAEIFKVEKSDEPIQKLIVDLISELEIINLVIGFTFMKTSSWKSKSAISGSFYVYRNKPRFCELFVIWGGKQVFLKGENHERIMEDDKGVRIAKIGTKHSLKGWLGKMFTEDPTTHSSERNLSLSSASASSSDSSSSRNSWDNNVQELENYYEELLSFKLLEEDCEQDQDSVLESSYSTPFNIPNHQKSEMNSEERIEQLRAKINEARETIELNKNEAKGNAERQAKAEWAINLCNHRAEELEAQIKKEGTIREELKKELDFSKNHIQEIGGDIQESKTRLSSLLELQADLSSKLQIATAGKSGIEAQLEKASKTQEEMVREIEELRRQRNILHRRIEFCKDKDAIGMAERSAAEVSCSTREYTAEEIRLATDNFSEQMRLNSGVNGMAVFRGRMSHTSVAIHMIDPGNRLSQEDFLCKVELLSHIRHPHLIAMIGFCSELKGIVFEYMHSGSLSDILLPIPSNKSFKKTCQALMWHDRIRIASEVLSCLGFLQQAQPRPICHGNLTLSKILLDRNLVAKVSGLKLTELDEACDIELDIQAFGALLLHLVTGRNWDGQIEKALAMDNVGLAQILDDKAGKWPVDLVDGIIDLALRCVNPNGSSVSLGMVMGELDEIKVKAEGMVGKRRPVVAIEDPGASKEDADNVPRIFICPILQEVMKNPHVAADGFSYELEAIEQWIISGHDTSPMTNLTLKHPFLTPNHALRSLIQDSQTET